MKKFYLADRSGYLRFPLRVLEAFDSSEAMLARMAYHTSEKDDYEYELGFVSSATHMACSDLSIAVGKCLPMDRINASDLRNGPVSPEAEPIVRAFAARLDRVLA